MRYYLLSAIFSLAIIAVVHCNHETSAAEDEADANIVNVDVYYESLCYDSMQFVSNHLVPTFLELEDFLNITLIPYGKATHKLDEDSNTWAFVCQHGPAECQGNRAQACAIDIINNSPSILDPVLRQNLIVNLVGCVMSQRYPATAVPQCAEKNSLSIEIIKQITECASSSYGDSLLAGNGERTLALQPALSFVPTIVINKVFTQENQRDSLTDFRSVICRNISNQKPANC